MSGKNQKSQKLHNVGDYIINMAMVRSNNLKGTMAAKNLLTQLKNKPKNREESFELMNKNKANSTRRNYSGIGQMPRVKHLKNNANRKDATRKMRNVLGKYKKSQNTRREFYNRYGTRVAFDPSTGNSFMKYSILPHDVDQMRGSYGKLEREVRNAKNAYTKAMTGLNRINE